jgi:ATP-dependent Zn protease
MPNSTGLGTVRSYVPIAAVIALLACSGALSAAMPAVAAEQTAQEGIVVLEGQLYGHQVRAVTLHTKAHKLRVTLKDGSKVSVVFPASEQQRLLEDVRGHGVTVKVTTAQPPSHTRRYVAIGVAAVALVALALGVWLYLRRRRMREEEYGPRVR